MFVWSGYQPSIEAVQEDRKDFCRRATSTYGRQFRLSTSRYKAQCYDVEKNGVPLASCPVTRVQTWNEWEFFSTVTFRSCHGFETKLNEFRWTEVRRTRSQPGTTSSRDPRRISMIRAFQKHFASLGISKGKRFDTRVDTGRRTVSNFKQKKDPDKVLPSRDSCTERNHSSRTRWLTSRRVLRNARGAGRFERHARSARKSKLYEDGRRFTSRRVLGEITVPRIRNVDTGRVATEFASLFSRLLSPAWIVMDTYIFRYNLDGFGLNTEDRLNNVEGKMLPGKTLGMFSN